MILAPWTVEPWSISIDSEGPKKERKIISVCTMQPCLCAMTCYVFTINEYSQVAQLRQRESRTQTKCCEMQWSRKNSHNASQLIRPKAFEKFKFTIQMGLLIPNNLSMTTFGVIKCSSSLLCARNPCCSSGCWLSRIGSMRASNM